MSRHRGAAPGIKYFAIPRSYVPSAVSCAAVSRSLLELLAVLLSGVLLFVAQPPVDAGMLGWVALVPLTSVCLVSSPPKAFALGFISAFTAKSLSTSWVLEAAGIDVVHVLILGSYLALYTSLWCAMIATMAHHKGFGILAPAAWVVLDYLQANAGFLAASWGTLAQTQHANLPLIQIAALTGEYGVTFVVMLVTVALGILVQKPNWRYLAVVLIFLGVVHIGGWYYISHPPQGKPLTVAAVQPNIVENGSIVVYRNSRALDSLDRLSREAEKADPDLIVWPEGSLRQWVDDPNSIRRIQELVRSSDVAILFGTTENQKFLGTERADSKVRTGQHNSAFLARPDGTFSSPYHKIRLLPFAEYIPLRGIVTWPEWLVPPAESMLAGTNILSYSLNGAYISPIICWENIFADFVRRTVPEAPVAIAHISNLNSFGKTAAGAQHNSSSVFRAVENRSPVIVASNTGPSQVIDAFGRVVSRVESAFTEDLAIGTIQLYDQRTIYWRVGDLFVLFLTVVLAVGAVGYLRTSRILR